jgi:hypothetical protein
VTKLTVALHNSVNAFINFSAVYQTNGVKTRRSFILILITVHQNKIRFADFRVFSAMLIRLPFWGRGYDAASIGIWFPIFRDNVEDTKNIKDSDFSTPDDRTTTLSGNIRNQIPSNTGSYLKRSDTISTYPLRITVIRQTLHT